MKYLIKYISEIQYEVDVDCTNDAVTIAREELARMPKGTKLHGVVRADIGWPDTAPDRPTPRGRPPSGTPGTPTVPVQDQVEEFVFTRAAA